MLNFLGPNEVVANQPIVLIGIYDPQQLQTISLMAEDKYPLSVILCPKIGIWYCSLEKGLNTPGKRWLRLGGQDLNNQSIEGQVLNLNIINDQGNKVGSSFKIMVLKDTLLKAQPIDSSNLRQEQKQSLKASQFFEINRYKLVNDHVEVGFSNPFPGIGQRGYFYKKHILLLKSSQILCFDPEELPETQPGTQLLWIKQQTPLKQKPEDLAQLAENQYVELEHGSTYSLLGYACIADHFRVTLSQEIPGFGQTGYLYRHHLSILEKGQEIAFDQNALTLTIVNSTPFKKRPVDAVSLPESEKVMLPAGMVYGVQSYTVEEGHLKVALTENFPGFGNTGYFYPDFVQLHRGRTLFSPLPTLTYQGPAEVLVNQPTILNGTFDPAKVADVSLLAEDRFALDLNFNWQAGTWQVSLGKGFSEPGYRWLRLKATDKQGKLVGSQVINITVSTNPMTVGEALTLTVTEDTLFKIVPFDSATLNQNQKITVKAGQTFTVLKYGLLDGHLKVLLENAIPPIGSFGYIYVNHVRLTKGTEVFKFDVEDVPDTHINAQMLVKKTTKLKAKPVDSSNLDANQCAELMLGQTFAIKGYACVQGHFRVTLAESVPGFGNVGYIYWQHVNLIRDGETISYDPDSMTMTVATTTILKKYPVDSNELGSGEKATLPLGRVYGVSSYSIDENHIKVALTEELTNFGNTGYVFPNFVQFRRGWKPFNPLPPQIELNVPYFSQRDNPRFYWSTCNVTSIAMVMYYYGLRSQWGGQLEDELLQWCMNYAGTGSQTDHSVLSALIRAYGYKTSFSTTRRWSEIKNELINRRPVVLGADLTPSGHIITIIGYNREGYIVHDPWGDAYTGYYNTEGRRIIYSYGYMDRVAGPDGNVWAHFIEP